MYESAIMRFEPSSHSPHSPKNSARAGRPSDSRSDGFTGGCISLIVLLIEIPVALLLGLTSAVRGWGRADEDAVAPPTDWVPVLWLGGFTLGVLVIAVLFLLSRHPFAGAIQLLVAAVALGFTIAAGHDRYEGADPPSPSTRAAMAHASSNDVTDRWAPSGGCPSAEPCTGAATRPAPAPAGR